MLPYERPRRKQYVREWALAQAANGFVDYDNITLEISPSPEQAMVFAEKDNPIYLAGAFDIVAAMIEGEKKSSMHSEPAPVGAGAILQDACFRPGYVNNIVQNWLPALDGVEEKLKPGSKVGDVGCGFGFSTLLIAQAFS